MAKNNNIPQKIIAIGTSAGGLEPVQVIISNLPQKLGSASIIVAQHLSPHYKSMMRELLARKTHLHVEEIKNGGELRTNTIYTIPPDNDVLVSDNKFKLIKPDQRGPKPSINRLFRSIAASFGSKSIGIILSGTGSDGAIGLKAIKNAGGITIAQQPNTAKYDGMPKSAIEGNKLDYILPPEEIGHYFKKLIGRIRNYKEDPQGDGTTSQIQETVSRVLSLLEEKVGTDFSNYKTSTIYRRLEKRLQDRNFTDIDKYLSYVQNNEEELNGLFQYLLIGVTSFFRNPVAYEDLQTHLESYILNSSDKNLRIWTPGCASGEEAYSMAIAACEIVNRNNLHDFQIQVFATDIDKSALIKARTGIYDSKAVENVPEGILKLYFRKKGAKFEVAKHIRQMVLFTRHDLTSNPPFLKIDLLSCRNLLIYFNQSLQNHVMPIFHYSLKRNGLLFLGKSESLGSHENLFQPLNQKNKIYQTREVENNKVKLPHLKPIIPRKITPAEKTTPVKESFSIHEMVKETIYNTYEHPFIIIDSSMEMVEIFGDVSEFIKVKAGLANTNILKLLESELQLELRAVASKAINTSKITKGNLRKVHIDGKDHYLRFTVKPLMYSKPVNSFYMVVFEKIDLDEKLFRNREVVYEDNTSPQLVEMEHELASTKEHMNTLIEELETSNEELQALNEELQSSNEELQASNEELETSNEELQASNEELEIAYTELRSANEEVRNQAEEIKISEKKLQTLFNSALQGFIMIHKNYNVDTFNETARQFFHKYYNQKLTEGNSFFDLLDEDQIQKYVKLFRKVLEGKVCHNEQELTYSRDRKKYIQMTLTPVISEDKVQKILISFIDITNKKKAELALKQAHQETKAQREMWEQLSVLSPDFIAVIDPADKSFTFGNSAFLKLIKYDSIVGRNVNDVFNITHSTDLLEYLDAVKRGKKPQRLNEYDLNITGYNKKICVNITFSPLLKNSKVQNIIMYGSDITEVVESRNKIKEAHQAIAIEKDKLEKLLTNAPAYIAIHSGSDHVFEFVSKKYSDLIDSENLLGKKFLDVAKGQLRKQYLKYLDLTINEGKPYILHESKGFINHDSEETYFNVIFQPWFEGGEVKGVISFASDISTQVKSRKTLQANASFINTLNDSMPQKVWTATPGGVYDYLNKPMREYLGILSDPYKSFNKIQWYRYIHPDDRKLTATTWRESLSKGEDYKIEHRLKDSKDNFKWHLTRGLPLKDDKENILKWIGTSTDIDEQKRSEHMKDEFLSIASHELKTPLTTIQAYTDLLNEKMKEIKDEEAIIYVDKTLVNLEKLNILISDLLDISRIQAGKFNFDKEKTDFDAIIKEGIENVRHTSKSHVIKLNGNTGKKVLGDAQRLEQVVMNLLSNAIKYSPDNKEVQVDIKSNGKNVICEVSDEGIGISAQHLDNIFDRYYRANEKRNYISGLGIGLFITKQIIDMHEGEINVKSKKGKGSTFSFAIPISE